MVRRAAQTASALSTRQPVGCSGCLAWPFTIAFLGGGLAFAFFMTYLPLAGMVRAQSWTKTPCQIHRCEIKGNGDTNVVDVDYSYEFKDKVYRGNRASFMDMSTNTGAKWKADFVAVHRPNVPDTCYVNPLKPSEAVIDRGWVPDMWWGLFPVPFVAIGIGALCVATGVMQVQAHGRSTWQSRTDGDSGEPEVANDDEDPWSATSSDGPVTLTPEATPLQMLIGAIVVATFWNGILSIFLWSTVDDFRRRGFGAFEWGFTLFMIPFVLVGLGMIGFVFYSILALFNPRPTLIVNRASIPLGEDLEVSWLLTGRTSSIREFKITLKGTERATYRRGTTTATDSSVFAEIPVIETNQMFDMDEGKATVAIPADTMHTFESSNNKIVWSLEVRGEIPLWPDVAASFPITILPHAPRHH